MFKVITMGEALIDFIPVEKGKALKDVSSFLKKPGGAPANVAACVAKLGGKACFIGKLGKDAFGDFIIETFKNIGVDISGVIQTDEANTALAFVTLDESGNRDFTFYRNPSADMLFNETEIDLDIIDSETILHFCSVSLIDYPVKKAHLKAIEKVRSKGGIISFDPNVRLPLWKSEEDLRKAIHDFLPFADILKLAEEELIFITGIRDEDMGVEYIFNNYNPAILLLTKGENGSAAYFNGKKVIQPPYPVNAVDTTGAGDAFIGGFLYMVSIGEINLKSLNEDDVKKVLYFSNKVGALTTTAKGAIEALPYLNDIQSCKNKPGYCSL